MATTCTQRHITIATVELSTCKGEAFLGHLMESYHQECVLTQRVIQRHSIGKRVLQFLADQLLALLDRHSNLVWTIGSLQPILWCCGHFVRSLQPLCQALPIGLTLFVKLAVVADAQCKDDTRRNRIEWGGEAVCRCWRHGTFNSTRWS
jgi:hypothetical protein